LVPIGWCLGKPAGGSWFLSFRWGYVQAVPNYRHPFALTFLNRMEKPMSEDRTTTIKAVFETREAADLAVEHLVQQHGVSRPDIFVQSTTDQNTAGVRPSGGQVARFRKQGRRRARRRDRGFGRHLREPDRKGPADARGRGRDQGFG
jgi:hypothetical protein